MESMYLYMIIGAVVIIASGLGYWWYSKKMGASTAPKPAATTPAVTPTVAPVSPTASAPAAAPVGTFTDEYSFDEERNLTKRVYGRLSYGEMEQAPIIEHTLNTSKKKTGVYQFDTSKRIFTMKFFGRLGPHDIIELYNFNGDCFLRIMADSHNLNNVYANDVLYENISTYDQANKIYYELNMDKNGVYFNRVRVLSFLDMDVKYLRYEFSNMIDATLMRSEPYL